MKTTLFCFVLFLITGIAAAQTPDPVQAIRDLKEGVLVVRLRTQSNKIKKLEEYLARETPGSPVYERLAGQLEETRREATLENAQLVAAFGDLYRFSEVLFVYDTLAPFLKEENPAGIFMGASLNPDPALSLAGRPFLLAGMGTVSSSQGASGHDDSLIVFDRNFNALPRPFPGYHGMSTIQMLWLGFTRSEEVVSELNIRHSVEQLNKKLFRYHSRLDR